MADVEFSIESTAGSIALASEIDQAGDFRLMKGTRGLGLPVDVVRLEDSASGGGSYRGHRVAMRDAVLVVEINGRSRSDTETKLRRLARCIDASASPQLVARYLDGSVYRLGFYRVGGGEDTYGDYGERTVEWELDVQCPDPYWLADEPVPIKVSQDGQVTGLLPELAELHVMPSSASGTVTVENPGDVPAPMTWRITGPGGPARVNVNGRGFVFEEPIGADEVITVERTRTGWRVTDQTGASRYPDLGPAPKFPSAPVGPTVVIASLENADPGTSSITGFFRPRRKLVH